MDKAKLAKLLRIVPLIVKAAPLVAVSMSPSQVHAQAYDPSSLPQPTTASEMTAITIVEELRYAFSVGSRAQVENLVANMMSCGVRGLSVGGATVGFGDLDALEAAVVGGGTAWFVMDSYLSTFCLVPTSNDQFPTSSAAVPT